MGDARPPLHNRPLEKRSLPQEVIDARAFQAEFDAANEEVAGPRIEAQIAASLRALNRLESFHQEIADETNLDLLGYSQSSACWLLSGRCLGLAEAMWALVSAGVAHEALVIGRSIHEATRLLLAVGLADDEDLLRLWLDDDGRNRYVKPKAAREAHAAFEERLAEVVLESGGTPKGDAVKLKELVETMYDLLSREAHNRRSACVRGVWEQGRLMTYGPDASPLHRGYFVDWAGALSIEVAHYVGQGLTFFYGGEFFPREVQPLKDEIESARREFPLDEGSIRQAAGTVGGKWGDLPKLQPTP